MRKFFQRLTLREKVLLSALIWCGLIIAAFFLLGSYVKVVRELNQSGAVLAMQDQWYRLEPILEDERQRILQHLNPKNTFSGSSLAGRIDSLARSSRVTPTINTPRTRSDDKLNLHTMRVSLKNDGMAEILDFENKVQSEWPYIKIESVQISRRDGKNNPDKHDVLYIINSFEFNDEAVQ